MARLLAAAGREYSRVCDPVYKEISAESPGEQNKKLSIKIEDNLQKIGLRLEHFIKSGRALDEDIEQSFLDTIKELEWRLKEFDLFVQNKDLKLRHVNK